MHMFYSARMGQFAVKFSKFDHERVENEYLYQSK